MFPVRWVGDDASVALCDQHLAQQPAVWQIDVPEEASEPVAVSLVPLEADPGPDRCQLSSPTSRLRPETLGEVPHLRRVDADQPQPLSSETYPHLQSIAVDHPHDGRVFVHVRLA